MALRERNLRLFLIGYTSSLVGSAMVPVALVFAVLDSGHGTGALGVVLAAQTIPLLLLLLLGGVVGDKVPRKLAMLSADIVRFASEGLLASLLLLGRPPLWSIAALAAVLGGGQAFFNPAMSGLMPQLVSAEYLQDANALRGIASSSAQVVGPALAGVPSPSTPPHISSVLVVCGGCASRLDLQPIQVHTCSPSGRGGQNFGVEVGFGL
jgi:MFS family permease